jgi:hypothetical protein
MFFIKSSPSWIFEVVLFWSGPYPDPDSKDLALRPLRKTTEKIVERVPQRNRLANTRKTLWQQVCPGMANPKRNRFRFRVPVPHRMCSWPGETAGLPRCRSRWPWRQTWDRSHSGPCGTDVHRARQTWDGILGHEIDKRQEKSSLFMNSIL